MPDQALRQRAPLEALARPGRFGATSAAAGVMLSEIRDRGLASVAARKNQRAALLAAAKSAFGCGLPTRPRRAFGRDGLSFVWAGPDQWVAMLDHGPVGGIEPRLAASLKGLASVVDQSDGRAVVRIGG
ncbi:MAG: hypothetical protein JOZ40_12790, partial [Methylobacteriaceae bacterium]|nr:hypothetical protein [Methylobacteriaceae bacterium]